MTIDWDHIDWYLRTRGAQEEGPAISISKAGRVVMNEDALNLFGKWPPALQVGVIQGNRSEVTLVLKSASKGDTGSLTVTKQGRKFSLNTSKFLKDRGLIDHFGNEKVIKPEFDHEHNALIATL